MDVHKGQELHILQSFDTQCLCLLNFSVPVFQVSIIMKIHKYILTQAAPCSSTLTVSYFIMISGLNFHPNTYIYDLLIHLGEKSQILLLAKLTLSIYKY